MKSSYKSFSKYKEDAFEKLKISYELKVSKASNKKKVSLGFQDDLSRSEYKKIQIELGAYSNVIISIKDELERDVNKEFEHLFNDASKSFPTKKKTSIIQLLAKLDAMDEFFYYWENQELNSKNELRNVEKEKVIWKGKSQTEFVQLIYMLFHSKLVSNESNLITKLVPEIAELLNFKLTENWKNDISSSIHKTKIGYQPPILEKLRSAFDSYKDEKIDKKRKN
jgi:hypothetical protein